MRYLRRVAMIGHNYGRKGHVRPALVLVMRVLFFILTASAALAANLPKSQTKSLYNGLKLFDGQVASVLNDNYSKFHHAEKV